MKRVEIKQFTHAEVDDEKETFGFLKIPVKHKIIRAEGESLEVSDGYHTFNELYEHRITLYIALCKMYMRATGFKAWRSKLHSDGSGYNGWFVLGLMHEPGKQITYHLPDSKWEEANFAETIEKAFEWDQHTPNDVLERIKAL